MNKTSTNSLIFYFDEAKQKKCVFRLHEKIYQNFCFVKKEQSINALRVKSRRSKNNSNVSLPAKMEKLYGMHKLVGLQSSWSGTPTFSSGTPTFCQMGVLNSCFQNPSESSAKGMV